ncbi:hypothetical protein IGI04_008848 [Brassica rapa subsp. trilocularis]|uniref:Uncharacterized protein n=1 Tax=Brassica rapa subsp. trilocularis TaxID=1813537 RepID=A0ABQ7MVL7_BRACM|nr:hypothetical protein IGI04_008848 [Brassica rapa subsp. trilocularis]
MMAFIGDYRRNPIIGSSFLVSLSLSIKPEEEEEKRIGHGFAEQTPRDGHDEMVCLYGGGVWKIKVELPEAYPYKHCVGAAWETVNEKTHKEDKGLAGSSKIQRAHIDVKPLIFKFRGK